MLHDGKFERGVAATGGEEAEPGGGSLLEIASAPDRRQEMDPPNPCAASRPGEQAGSWKWPLGGFDE